MATTSTHSKTSPSPTPDSSTRPLPLRPRSPDTAPTRHRTTHCTPDRTVSLHARPSRPPDQTRSRSDRRRPFEHTHTSQPPDRRGHPLALTTIVAAAMQHMPSREGEVGKLWNPPSACPPSTHVSQDPPWPLGALAVPSRHAYSPKPSIPAPNTPSSPRSGERTERADDRPPLPSATRLGNLRDSRPAELGNLWNLDAGSASLRMLSSDSAFHRRSDIGGDPSCQRISTHHHACSCLLFWA
jgi:hypothetical protein